METLNPGILGVLMEVGSVSSIFSKVGGMSARRVK